ncbi:MAG: hypothetical protein ACJAUP_001868 [Cellvibrionaceae bacterium]|jgi:hypothetical protein
MTLETLLQSLNHEPYSIEFQEVMKVIDSLYAYTPTEFTNGNSEDKVINIAGTNEGSCRLFAFALDQQLTQQQTLHCFGRYYREDVLQHPENNDHANIRNFIRYGWEGMTFSGSPLTKK